MKRNLLKAAVLAIGGTIALASSPVMAQEAKSLDELLQMVKQGRASDAREQKAREQRFKNARYDQQKMLKEAEKTLGEKGRVDAGKSRNERGAPAGEREPPRDYPDSRSRAQAQESHPAKLRANGRDHQAGATRNLVR